MKNISVSFLGIEIAKKDGIAIASIKNITHFGFGGFYTELATKSNLIGLALCNTEPAAAPFGGKGKVLGTNPISFSVPRYQCCFNFT